MKTPEDRETYLDRLEPRRRIEAASALCTKLTQESESELVSLSQMPPKQVTRP